MTFQNVPPHLRPFVEWRDKADIPNEDGYKIVLMLRSEKLVPPWIKRVNPYEELKAMVTRHPVTNLHSLVSYAGTPIDFTRVICWKHCDEPKSN